MNNKELKDWLKTSEAAKQKDFSVAELFERFARTKSGDVIIDNDELHQYIKECYPDK